jgi:DNA-binding response OmpR family regulator
VVIDYDLPDGRGYSLAKELRALQADLPILLVVDRGVAMDTELFQGDRCTEWITKPYQMETFHRTLDKLGAACATGK